MIKNYFKTALAHLIRSKTYSLISISSLTIGLAVCILLFLYVRHELSYDRFHKNADTIYRLCNPEHPYHAPPAAQLLADNIPEIKAYTRILPRDYVLIEYQTKRFKEDKVAFSDADLFRIFSFNFKQGNPETALQAPLTIVVSEKTALKYFGNEDPVGNVLKLNNEESYTVTGVMEDMPQNSHFRYDIIGTLAGTEKEEDMNDWGWQNFLVYFQLQEQFSQSDFELKCSQLLKNPNTPNEPLPIYSIQNLKDIHLYSSHFKNDIQPQNSIVYILIFSAIGFLVLLIACFNYINLLTANATTRANEIGMRKVCGASRKQLAMQYLSETIVVVFISFCLSILVVSLCLPLFNELSGKELSFSMLWNLKTIMGIFSILLTVSVLAGLYPAFILSSFTPAKTLKSSKIGGESTFHFRKILVGAQFTIVIALIACSIVMFRQISFLQQKELGFDKENVLLSDIDDFGDEEKFMTLKQALLDQNMVVSVSAANRVPSGDLSNVGGVLPEGQKEVIAIPFVHVNYDYFETLGINAAQGRLLSDQFKTDADESIILNEAAVASLGIQGDPIGQSLRCFWYTRSTRKIVGIVKDFHFESLYEEIKPAVFLISYDECRQLLIKVKPNDLPTSINSLTKICKNIYPDQVVEFRYLSAKLEQLYQSDTKTFQLMGYFSALAIILASMGLFGIASFIIIRRTKEIGIRKVNGANVSEIMQMLSMSFLRWISIAFIIATPIAYYFMNRWLENFANKTTLSWWVFALAGFLVVVIALLTISWQSYRAATRNLVETLRYE
ncbi:MAG: ABC transporter permease [Bacteroidales bacterium]|nr:ABC transporter permease [Bacteroidales bacterium]